MESVGSLIWTVLWGTGWFFFSPSDKIDCTTLNFLLSFLFWIMWLLLFKESWCYVVMVLRVLICSFIIIFFSFPGQIKKAEASSEKGKQSTEAERRAWNWVFISSTLRQSIRRGRSEGVGLGFSWDDFLSYIYCASWCKTIWSVFVLYTRVGKMEIENTCIFA